MNQFKKLAKEKYIFIIGDCLLGVLTFYMAFYLRFDGSIPEVFLNIFNKYWLFYVSIRLITFFAFGIYKRLWKYAVIGDLISIGYAITAAILLLISLSYYLQDIIPRSVFILTWIFDIVTTSTVRVVPKVYSERNLNLVRTRDAKRTLVVGAGDAGVLVVKEIKRRNLSNLYPIGFIDDDPDIKSLRLLGLPVFGTRQELTVVIREHDVQEVLIAMPSAPGKVIREIVETCRATQISVRILPRMYDIINGELSVDLIREVKLEDLLGREPITLDMPNIDKCINQKRIMVTGAGGSIGAELCRQICRFNPKELLVLGHDENPIFEIEMELKSKYPELVMKCIMADVKDRNRIFEVFGQYAPQMVFHAAAHKHVPLMEQNPCEAFKNNVVGTKNIAEAADRFGVETFVLISTDKAVNPTSVMGGSKRIAEILIQSMNEISNTKYVAVRFGNVLGSRGSAIPIFQEQIRKGGPVTVTHPDMRRYFMTIPEAVQLVLQAASMANGGEIFILDMGEPVKIVDLARELIRLSGFEPEKDISIKFTGIRPGEKLYEEILTNEEGTSATKHSRIFVAKKQEFNTLELDRLILRINSYNYCHTRTELFQLLHLLEGTGNNLAEVTLSK